MKILPTSPTFVEPVVGYVDFGNTLTPPLGGPDQRINRPGNRHRVSGALPPIKNKDEGRVWVARLKRGMSEGVRMKFPLGGFDPGSPGSPQVNGSGQSGRIIQLSGFQAGYVVKEGQYFSIFTGGAHYVYSADEEVTAASNGTMQLTIDPLLRISPNNGDVCHFEEPMIEGLIEGSERQWQFAVDHTVGIEFGIKERR